MSLAAAWLVLSLLLGSSTPAALSQGVGEPVPAPEALASSLAKLKESYKEGYARTGRQDKRELAAEFLQLAGRSDAEWAASDLFVLLDQARELSIAAADVPTAFAAIGELRLRFAVELDELRLAAVKAIAPGLRKRAEAAEAVTLVLACIEDLLAAGAWQKAERFLTSAEALARRSRDDELERKAERLARKVADAREVAELMERLKRDPEDAEASGRLGARYCFVDGDFERGLPLLTRSGPGELRELAVLDAAAPTLPAERMRVGSLWLDWGRRQTGAQHARALERARHWYRLAMPELARFKLIEVEKALQEIGELLAREGAARIAAEAAARAVPPPAAVKRLDRSRNTYATDLAALRGDVASALASARASLAEAEDPVERWRLAQIEGALAALSERGEFPVPPLVSDRLQSRIDKVRDRHRKELERCLGELSDDEDEGEWLEAVEEELEEFEADPAGLFQRMARMPPAEAGVDLFFQEAATPGKWELAGDGLVWRGASHKARSPLVFGDPNWADYDLIVTVRVDEVAPREFSILARYDADQAWELNAGGWGLNNRDLRPVVADVAWWKSPARRFMRDVRSTEPGEIFEIGIRVRNASAAAILDGEEVRTTSHAAITQGRIGVWSWDHSTFLDFEVRDPEGMLLWKGLPKLSE